jgi:hypothetical protein
MSAESSSGSPYATGGGGVVFEHRFGAAVLACLLAREPISLLGDATTPTSIRFQASAFSRVDDLLVIGQTPNGGQRKISIGVRRSPVFTKSDDASVKLLVPYIEVLLDHGVEVQNGHWRLGLVVANPTTAVQQIGELTLIARGTRDARAFRTEVERPRRTNQGVRKRLEHLNSLVEAVAGELERGEAVETDELTWRLLTGLHLAIFRLEGADHTDRTHAVRRLQPLTRERTPEAADTLFAKLTELADAYAPQGAEVTEATLRRDLAGIPLGDSPAYARAWSVLGSLGKHLRTRTGFRLVSPAAELELERSEARNALKGAMETVASSGSALLVTGEPDVGKSALTLRSSEQIAAEGVAVMSLSLRDLPPRTVELETLLGGPLAEVLGAAASGGGRLLVIDGAEAALEGRDTLLSDLAGAALGAGYGVVAVTRFDGRNAVAEALERAAEHLPIEEHTIPGLGPAETAEVAATFSHLAGLAQDARSRWLLARPGLVDLLLRAGPGVELPEGPLSEAEVFAAIWSQLVRRGEASPPGASSPDAREQALLELARGLLVPTGPRTGAGIDALGSLRSDGLLLSAGPTSVWKSKDEFASDLVRDFAVARLLIVEGWGVLDKAAAPRWALRAVRLACQARLVEAGEETEATRERLQAEFRNFGERHGSRWAEVPLEALLTLGTARAALTRAWPGLVEGEAAELQILLRLALQRYSSLGFGTPDVLAPVVELTFCGQHELGQNKRYSEVGEQIRDLILAWLRGLVKAATPADPLRQRVRERILDADPPPYDEFAVEALGTLGPDLNDRAKEFLETIAENSPGHLAPLVEATGAPIALAVHDPAFLIDLTESYYVKKPDPKNFRFSSLDDGIRHHRFTGLGAPMAAWWFGPFFRLLNVRPRETISMINRMLDHAAAVRVGQLRSLENDLSTDSNPSESIELELPSIGSRRCVGDSHVWGWYRGSTVGPYPCMSALLALERFCDHLVDQLEIQLEKVVEMLLHDCHNLAMPGLVAGILVRHLESAETLLDDWLSDPRIWQLEFGRAVAEGSLHIQGPDDRRLVGRDRRRFSFRDVAAQMTVTSMFEGNSDRLAVLAATGEELIRKARAGGYEDEELVAVEGWAAGFRSENYKARRFEGGEVGYEFEPPNEVASVLQNRLQALSKTNRILGLKLKYTASEDRSGPVDSLGEDIEIARKLACDQAVEADPFGPDGIAAVAAAGIVAHAEERATVSSDDLAWASEVLVDAAMGPRVDDMSFESTTFPDGADRSAAAALPLLLLPRFEGLDARAIEDALMHCALSIFDEVRAALVVGLRPVWKAPCHRTSESGRCFHETAWTIVEGGIQDCRMGEWDDSTGRRGVAPLDPPFAQSLASVPTDSLLANRLVHPLVAASDAALSEGCVASDATALLAVLHDADRRAARHWAEEGYGHFSDHQRALVARVLIEQAVAGDESELKRYVREFLSCPSALGQLLRDLALTFTYDDLLRRKLTPIWRCLMAAALEEIESREGFPQTDRGAENAFAGLIPVPQLEIADADPDATLSRADEDWISPEDIADLVERWLRFGKGRPASVDAIARLTKTASAAWQATTGVAWIERAIAGDYASVANSCWFLPECLERIRADQPLSDDAASAWRRIVDGLAAEGDNRALALQRAEE